MLSLRLPQQSALCLSDLICGAVLCHWLDFQVSYYLQACSCVVSTAAGLRSTGNLQGAMLSSFSLLLLCLDLPSLVAKAAFMQARPFCEASSSTLVAFDLQSAAEEEARMASMSADERKKYKQKQRKVCPARSPSCTYMTCLLYLCILFQAQHRRSRGCLTYPSLCLASLSFDSD